VKRTLSRPRFAVSADGRGVVGHAGTKGTYEISVTSSATDSEAAKKIGTNALAMLLDAVA
jgi:hypothetical protein